VFNNLLKLLASIALKSFAASGAWQAQVQGLAAYVKRFADEIFSTSGSSPAIKITLEHILLFAILLVLIGIWRGQAPPKPKKAGPSATPSRAAQA
jgi:hypothetical protein